jgi:hypothetical protein
MAPAIALMIYMERFYNILYYSIVEGREGAGAVRGAFKSQAEYVFFLICSLDIIEVCKKWI